MPIKRIAKKPKAPKREVKTVAQAKKKAQAQAQTNVQKINIKIGEAPKRKRAAPSQKRKDEKRETAKHEPRIVIAPTIAPSITPQFLHPYPQVKTGYPTLMESAIKKEEYINNHSSVVVGGTQNQRLLTPSDVFATHIQPKMPFSFPPIPASMSINYDFVEEEDHKGADPEQLLGTISLNPGAMPRPRNVATPKK